MSNPLMRLEPVPVVECNDCPFLQTITDVSPFGDTRNVGLCGRCDGREIPDNLASPPDWCPLRERLHLVVVVSRLVV